MKCKGRKPSGHAVAFARGVTLIEMTVVILVLLTLTGAFFVTTGPIDEWKKGKAASTVLRDVEVAQRQFLADHPQRAVETLTNAEVAGYLQGSPDDLPTVEDLDGNRLNIQVTSAPPVAISGGGVYDPSGSSEDSLWDVGK
jgi:type II secretory pathway pseudopilin PulG